MNLIPFPGKRGRSGWLRCDSPKVMLSAQVCDGEIYLLHIRVDTDSQGQGLGSMVMRKLIKLSEGKGLPIILTPLAEDRSRQAELVSWYKGFGFHWKNGWMVRPI